jgi:HD-GYP domain-containing protein (c-di-GMP phosphodiesterase class II)
MVNPLNFIRASLKKSASPEDDAAPVVAEAQEAPATETSAPDQAGSEAVVAEAATPVAAPVPEAPADEAAEETPDAVGQPRAGDLVGADDHRAAVDAAARATYNEALQVVGRFFKAASEASEGRDEAPRISEIEEVADKLVSGAADEHIGDSLIAHAVGPYPDEGRFIVPHSVNVAVLSQRVARQLGLEGQELHTLVIAALMHDVGTVRIPKEIFYKDDSLSNDEWELMRQRPIYSNEIIGSLGPAYRAVGEIAHQVHERLDGNGYPRGLTVESIALEASILGAVDIFEAFIHPRPYKKTVPAAAMYGVDNLMRMAHQFGDGVLKALVRSVGLFPVGTHVRLNSGEIARVLRGRPSNPMRPEVDVVLDTQKRPVAPTKYIDLMSTPHLYVFKPISPEELAELGIQ